jgi:hypothetical protein
MEWFGEFAVTDGGMVAWREGMRVNDPTLFEAYRQNMLVQFTIETSSQFGVKVGQA